MNKIKWLDKPKDHNYVAAQSYMTLLETPGRAKQLVLNLQQAEMGKFLAKDIFRASRLPLLGVSHKKMLENKRKIVNKEPLSPILLVRGKNRLIIADGYHRMCAVYSYDEEAWIPCKII